ncbi:hypothetical protein LEM8419_00545 [Neolewinella maritima]|uniref:Uracil-DNA glycosylase-like domain-containing protein n=1 Tax=Neolewinella maritima TaxID=1383882 RepID=A0ABM9AXS5_9BACT|nr:uracil-DNA glycosylase family protein [Neolewinella maritima]CAH0999248.1 hypothetical protein LEM8419_00545 [Neolewinella maritima]
MDWQPYKDHFARSLAAVPPEQRVELLRLGMAPFASDPALTLRPAKLMVVSMKPYGAPDRSYACGWDERAVTPGLHRWYDGGRQGSNFVREADELLTYLIDRLGLSVPAHDILNVYAYFYRAADAKQLRELGLDLLDCTEFHRAFLATVQPQVILCIGNGAAPSAFATYRALLDGDVREHRIAPRLLLRSFTTPDGLRVIGVPHLSYIRAAPLLAAVGTLLEEGDGQ